MSRPKKKASCAFSVYDDVANWDVHRLLQWLRQNGLHSSIDTFGQERIDGRILLSMTEAELSSKRGINEKDKKKLVKALALLPNSQISRQPGIMTRLRGQLKKKIGRDEMGAPPPVPQADYYTVMDDREGGGGGGGWDSDEFESSDDSEYEEPPGEYNESEGGTERAMKFQDIQQKFQAAGFRMPGQQQQRVYEVDDEEIYDAPEPDDHYPHRNYPGDEDLYVPPQGVDELEGETYEVPEIESNPALRKRTPPRIPPPIRTSHQTESFPNAPMSPTEPPPLDEFGYGGPEGVYDLPPDADGVEVQPPPPPVISKPSLPTRFGPAPPDPQKPSGNVAQKLNIFRGGQKPGLPKEPELPDRSTKPQRGGGRLSPGRSKPPPLPSKDESFGDVDDMALPSKPSLPSPVFRPSASGHLKGTQLQQDNEFHLPAPGRACKPAMPSRDTKPMMPSRVNKPSLPPMDAKPPLPATDTRPPLPVPDTRPPLPVTDTRPPLPAADTRPPLPATDTRPPLPATDTRPPLPAMDTKPPQSGIDTKSSLPGRDSRPLLPGRDTKPILPGRDSKPVVPGGDSKPTLPGRDSKPVVPGGDSRPSLPGRDAKPSLPGGDSRPALPGRDSKPPLPVGDSKPALPGRDSKPPFPGEDLKPALPGRDTKPVIPGMESKVSMSDRDERRSSGDNRSLLPEPLSIMQENEFSNNGVANAIRDAKPKRPVSPKPVKRDSSPAERHPPLPISAKPVIPPPTMNRKSSPIEAPLPISPKPNVRIANMNRSNSPIERQPPLPISAKPVALPSSIPYPSCPKPSMKPFAPAKEKRLEDYDWFQGDIDRKACEAALKRNSQDGLFMVRNSKNYPGEFSISFFYKGEIKHLRIRKRADNMFSVGAEKVNEKAFRNVVDLVDFHQSEPLSLKTGGLMKLKRACPL